MVLRITEIISTEGDLRMPPLPDQQPPLPRPSAGEPSSTPARLLGLPPTSRRRVQLPAPYCYPWVAHLRQFQCSPQTRMRHGKEARKQGPSEPQRIGWPPSARRLRNLHSPALHFRHYRSSPDRSVPEQLFMVRQRQVRLVELVLADVGHSANQFIEPRGAVILNQLISLLHIWINRGELRILSLKPLNRPLAVSHKQTTGHSLRLLHTQPHRQVPGRPRRRRHAAPQAHSASCRHASAGSGHRPQNHG